MKKCIKHGPYESTCTVCNDLELSMDERWAAEQELQDDLEDTEEYQAALRDLRAS